jgi:hypothetical protein
MWKSGSPSRMTLRVLYLPRAGTDYPNAFYEVQGSP